jgi:hypothetical protein
MRMSSKIYDGALCSLTTIQPGKNRDDYWCNDDMCHHLVEVAMICKWVHRSFSSRPVVGDSVQEANQPKLIFIFDGSSNHGARAMDARHVGGGINRGAGGKNVPGSKGTTRNQDGLPKMRNGWYVHEETQVLTEQVMHRNVLDTASQLCKDSCNADGTTHKGLFEILQERGDGCMAVDGKAMTKTCSKQRRCELNFATDHACDCGVRCCLENTLRWEPDFAAQK